MTSVSRSLIDYHGGGAASLPIQETNPGISNFYFNIETGVFLHPRNLIWIKGGLEDLWEMVVRKWEDRKTGIWGMIIRGEWVELEDEGMENEGV